MFLGLSASGAQLLGPRVNPTNAAYFDFRIACQSREHHLIQWSQDLTNWATYQHSLSTLTNRPVQVPMSVGPRAFWRTVLTNEPMFPYALIARRSINFSNFNIATDSFDSTDPAHSLNGMYDPSRRLGHGDIAISGSEANPVWLDKVTVRGVLHVASNVSVSLRNGSVGDLAFVDDPVNAGLIQTNHFREDAGYLFLPDVTLPPNIPWVALVPAPSRTNVDGVDYAYVLPTGDYRVDGWSWSESTLITGNVRIWVTSAIDFIGNDQVHIAPNGSLQVFASCSNVRFGGQGIVNDTGRALNFLYFGTSQNTSLVLGANGLIIGAFYAPAATVTLRGNGNPLEFSDFVGSIAADRIDFQAPHAFHYDEALATQGPMK